jgi:hypothetical protein
VTVARRVLSKGIFDRFVLPLSELLSVRFFAVEWNAWATLHGQSLEARSSCRVKSRVAAISPALQISSRRTLCASLQGQTMVRQRLSLRERRWSFSAWLQKNMSFLCPNRSGVDTGSNHQAALKRMTLLIRTPQTLLDSILPRRSRPHRRLQPAS